MPAERVSGEVGDSHTAEADGLGAVRACDRSSIGKVISRLSFSKFELNHAGPCACAPGVCAENLTPNILVMKSTEDRT